jgi:hypothetical protein
VAKKQAERVTLWCVYEGKLCSVGATSAPSQYRLDSSVAAFGYNVALKKGGTGRIGSYGGYGLAESPAEAKRLAVQALLLELDVRERQSAEARRVLEQARAIQVPE